MKVYITKYSLTSGIEEIDSENVYSLEVDEDGWLSVVRSQSRLCEVYKKSYYTTTKEEAIKQAEDMRKKKIENLKKQIKRLEKINFEEMVK